MSGSIRDAMMIPGRCSFCGRPAEQHAVSRHWWHTAESCNPAYAITHAGDVPAGRLGWQAGWPARFESKPPIRFEVEPYRPDRTDLLTAATRLFGADAGLPQAKRLPDDHTTPVLLDGPPGATRSTEADIETPGGAQ